MRPAVVAVIGAGPSGVSVLERIGANAPELLGDRPLEVHLVDPYPPGPGRHWRHDQSPLLMLNTTAANVRMFTDDTVVCQGPIRTGPSLADWAGESTSGDQVDDETAELAALTGTSYPTRRLNSHYLRWVYERAVAGCPPNTRILVHRDRAVDLVDLTGDRERVLLAGGTHVDADAVVLAVGHQDVEPTTEQAALAEYATEHGLFHLPPGYVADEDLSALRPGQDVLVRGLGLGFVDLAVLLTEGRGGRFTEDGSGGLRYLRSGREPVLHAGSRRGVPFAPKRSDHLPALPPLPRFFDPERILRDGPARLAFDDVLSAVAREIEWAYYHTLSATQPDRVNLGPDELTGLFEAAVDEQARRDLARRFVRDPADLLDLARLDRPLAGMTFPDTAAVHRHVTAHLRHSLDRAADPRFSADLGLLFGVLSVFARLPVLLDSGRFSARSWQSDVDGWWLGLVNSVISGPPPLRTRQLVALAEAGVLRFVGPDMWVRAADGRFSAGSSAVASSITATALIEARLPVGTAPRSRDPLIGSLYDRAALTERTAVDDDGYRYRTGFVIVDQQDGAVLDTAGHRHPRRFALGPFTTAPAGGNFTRPGMNSVSSRLTDGVARAALLAARTRL